MMPGLTPIQILDSDDLCGSGRVRIGIFDNPDAAGGPVATVVDYFPRNVRVPAHAPEEPRGGLPDRDPFVPTQKVQPAQKDHQREQGARQHTSDQGAQNGSTRKHGDQREEKEEQPAPLEG